MKIDKDIPDTALARDIGITYNNTEFVIHVDKELPVQNTYEVGDLLDTKDGIYEGFHLSDPISYNVYVENGKIVKCVEQNFEELVANILNLVNTI